MRHVIMKRMMSPTFLSPARRLEAGGCFPPAHRMPSVKTWRELLRTPSMRSSQNSPSETVWKSGIALSSGCHLWVKGCEEALFGRLQRSDEDDGDPLQLFSKQFLHALR